MAKTAAKKAGEKPAAELIKDTGNVSIPIEEMQQTTGNGLQVTTMMTPDQIAQLEIKRFDVPRNWIAEKKQEYTGLKISGEDDKEGRQKVHNAWKIIQQKRIEVEKKHKVIKADHLIITRAIDTEKNELVELLEAIENPLKEELDRIEKLKQDRLQAAERALMERLSLRVDELRTNGVGFNGSYYVIGETISMDVVTLKGLNDEDYGRLLERVKAENTRLIEAKELAEQKAAKEKKELEDLRQQQADNQKKLEDQKAEIQRQQDAINKQKEELLKARTKTRATLLENLGMKFNFETGVFSFGTFDCGRTTLQSLTVETLDDTDWQGVFNKTAGEIQAMKEQQARKDDLRAEQEKKDIAQKEAAAEAKRQKDQRERDRMAVLAHKYKMDFVGAGYQRKSKYPEVAEIYVTTEDVDTLDDTKWAELLASLDQWTLEFDADEPEAQRLQVAEAEKLRVSNMSDNEKITEYFLKFNALLDKQPEILNSEARGLLTGLNENIRINIRKTVTAVNKALNS